MNSSVLRTMCALHKLEVLTIKSCTFMSDEMTREEEEWEVADGDVFYSLQFLYLIKFDVVRWSQ